MEEEKHAAPLYKAPPRRALQPVQVEFTELESPSLPARETREIELREYKRQLQVISNTAMCICCEVDGIFWAASTATAG